MAKAELTPTELTDAPPEFYDRVWRLIDAYHPHLADARIRLQVRERAPNRTEGAEIMAETDTANNDAEKGEFDFSIWFALDEWAQLDEMQRDAITDHELHHCGWDEEGEPLLLPHDMEEFYPIFLRYGLWWPGADEFADVLAQMPPSEKGQTDMRGRYQRPLPGGGHGSTGAYQRPEPGGGHGSTGAYQQPYPGGGHGSTGAWQRPEPGGGHGSTGAYQQPIPGGGHGSTGAYGLPQPGGGHGSTGAYGPPQPGGGHGSTGAMTDPTLADGMDYEAIDLGNGVVLELSLDTFERLAAYFLGSGQRGNALKTVSKTAEELRVANYIALFGGRDLEGVTNNRRNADGSRGEFFSKRTEFASNYTDLGVLYVDWEHGQAPEDEPGADDVLGFVDWKTAKIDDKGLFVERVLNRRNKYVQFLEDLIDEGLIGTSSEAVSVGVQKAPNGEILKWPLRRDTMTVQPMEPRMISTNALIALKALAQRDPALLDIVARAEQTSAPAQLDTADAARQSKADDTELTPAQATQLADQLGTLTVLLTDLYS